ncbi:hypothetical protein BRC81_12120 [Halobacteriales archaeon QS_1_68_20]|nr:MAG: hypothetical protein BRC81_12120 [Halobacteriales archaeon QS_1_68_20]
MAGGRRGRTRAGHRGGDGLLRTHPRGQRRRGVEFDLRRGGPQGRPADDPPPADAGGHRATRTAVRADRAGVVHRATDLLRLRDRGVGVLPAGPRVLPGRDRRGLGAGQVHPGAVVPVGAGGRTRLFLPDGQAPGPRVQLVRPAVRRARRPHRGPRRDRPRLRRAGQPDDHGVHRPGRPRVGRHPLGGQPRGRQGPAVRDAVRPLHLEVRGVRPLLRRPADGPGGPGRLPRGRGVRHGPARRGRRGPPRSRVAAPGRGRPPRRLRRPSPRVRRSRPRVRRSRPRVRRSRPRVRRSRSGGHPGESGGSGGPPPGVERGSSGGGPPEDVRGALEEEGVYSGRPHGEDVYAVVLYSDAEIAELFEEVEGLRQSFDHYDTHVKTAVYEPSVGDGETAVVSIWATESAADTAAGFLTDLPGIVRRAGESDDGGWGTMGMFYTVADGYREDFVEIFEGVADVLTDMDGHVESNLLANHEDGDDMFIDSRWASREDAMEFFRSEAFADTVDTGRNILAERPRHVFLA